MINAVVEPPMGAGKGSTAGRQPSVSSEMTGERRGKIWTHNFRFSRVTPAVLNVVTEPGI